MRAGWHCPHAFRYQLVESAYHKWVSVSASRVHALLVHGMTLGCILGLQSFYYFRLGPDLSHAVGSLCTEASVTLCYPVAAHGRIDLSITQAPPTTSTAAFGSLIENLSQQRIIHIPIGMIDPHVSILWYQFDCEGKG